MIQWDLFLSCKYGSKFATNQRDVSHQLEKGQDHMIVPVDTEKAFDKVQHAYIIKTLNQVRLERTYFNIM